jgi:hypothetical protein
MIGKAVSFLFAAALLAAGAVAAFMMLFVSGRVSIGLLFGAGVAATVGAVWLREDFIEPWWRG